MHRAGTDGTTELSCGGCLTCEYDPGGRVRNCMDQQTTGPMERMRSSVRSTGQTVLLAGIGHPIAWLLVEFDNRLIPLDDDV